MVQIKNVEVWGLHKAALGMRNSWESWDKGDWYWEAVDKDTMDPRLKDTEVEFIGPEKETNDPLNTQGMARVWQFRWGLDDKTLATKLLRAGEAHHTFTDHIQVSFDISLPLDVWKQLDRYTVGRQRPLSTSTMHTLTRRPLTKDDFDKDAYVDLAQLNELIRLYHASESPEGRLSIKNRLNKSLPQGFQQVRTLQMNYTALRRIYWQRAGHPEPEWAAIRTWIEGLPEAWIFTTKGEGTDENNGRTAG